MKALGLIGCAMLIIGVFVNGWLILLGIALTALALVVPAATDGGNSN